jgi:hypothetical protein
MPMFRLDLSSHALLIACALTLSGIGEACSTTVASPADTSGSGGGGSGGKGSKTSHGAKGGSSSTKDDDDAGAPASAGTGDEPAPTGSAGTDSGDDGGDEPSGTAGERGGNGEPSDPVGKGGTTGSVGTGGTGDPGTGGTTSHVGDGDPEPQAGAAGAASTPPDDAVTRGLALTTENTCTTCHQDDYSGYAIYPNITPDTDTGIGSWSDDEIKDAILNGRGKDGSTFCNLMVRFPFNDQEASDIVAFLRSLPPRSNTIDSVCPGHVE